MAPNLAIVSIPAYFIFSLVPHTYAVGIAAKGNIATLDNRNPRSTTFIDSLRQKLTPDEFARYERCESAHKNNLESFPLFASAVLAGLLADGVGKGGVLTGEVAGKGTLRFVYSWFAVRTLFNVLYISTSNNKYTWIRSAVFFAGVGLAAQQFWRAAQILGA
ncbi:hypothetical protein CAC42_6219 [Sphaceloma murrayae]|uniref:Uncharacterized protein n=1 Tax=Sphaceloma murrayae TaxID=2082308 RepID=A0A2K1QTL5_9PEZI|nr:hypothetical protein CAC42_6219 [Sphaceloma murrayae]